MIRTRTYEQNLVAFNNNLHLETRDTTSVSIAGLITVSKSEFGSMSLPGFDLAPGVTVGATPVPPENARMVGGSRISPMSDATIAGVTTGATVGCFAKLAAWLLFPALGPYVLVTGSVAGLQAAGTQRQHSVDAAATRRQMHAVLETGVVHTQDDP